MTSVAEDEVRAAIAAERRDLAAILAGLAESGWDAATLCAGWRVREVIAHLTMPYRLSGFTVIRRILAAGGNFNRMADRQARRDTAELSSADLAGYLRDNAEHPWTPPGGGPVGALSHDVIHGLDVTVGLGLDRTVPADRLRIVLDGVNPRSIRYFGADLTGIRLAATDLDWTHGAGTPLTGSAQDLLLVLCGRKLPAGQLTGPDATRFTRTG